MVIGLSILHSNLFSSTLTKEELTSHPMNQVLNTVRAMIAHEQDELDGIKEASGISTKNIAYHKMVENFSITKLEVCKEIRIKLQEVKTKKDLQIFLQFLLEMRLINLSQRNALLQEGVYLPSAQEVDLEAACGDTEEVKQYNQMLALNAVQRHELITEVCLQTLGMFQLTEITSVTKGLLGASPSLVGILQGGAIPTPDDIIGWDGEKFTTQDVPNDAILYNFYFDEWVKTVMNMGILDDKDIIASFPMTPNQIRTIHDKFAAKKTAQLRSRTRVEKQGGITLVLDKAPRFFLEKYLSLEVDAMLKSGATNDGRKELVTDMIKSLKNVREELRHHPLEPIERFQWESSKSVFLFISEIHSQLSKLHQREKDKKKQKEFQQKQENARRLSEEKVQQEEVAFAAQAEYKVPGRELPECEGASASSTAEKTSDGPLREEVHQEEKDEVVIVQSTAVADIVVEAPSKKREQLTNLFTPGQTLQYRAFESAWRAIGGMLNKSKGGSHFDLVLSGALVGKCFRPHNGKTEYGSHTKNYLQSVVESIPLSS